MLVDLGFVTAQQVAALRAEAQSSGVGVVDLMLANKIIRSADVTQAKAAHFGAEVVNLSEMRIEDDVIATIPRHIAKKYRVVPVFKHDNNLTVALADPSDLDTLASLTHLLCVALDLRVAWESDIESALNKYYGAEKEHKEDSRGNNNIHKKTKQHREATRPGTDDGGVVEADAPLIKLVNQ